MSELLADILTLLEQDELKLLSWGYVDGGFTREELIDRIDAELLHRGALDKDPEDVLTDLLARRLLVEVPTGGGSVLRSRMAETIRLLARLRQLFPSHANSGWQPA